MRRCCRVLVGLAAVACLVSTVPVAEASFPGSNGLIAFARLGPGNASTIAVVDPRSGRTRAITEVPRRCAGRDPVWNDSDPSFAPSGRRLIYVHTDECDPRTPDGTYVIRPNDRGRKLLTRTLFDRPAFSPSGESVAFQDEQDSTRIARIDRPERQREVRLPRSDYGSSYPAWGATGRLALTVSGKPSDFGHIATVTADGKDLRLVTRSARDWAPDWSPAANRIAFMRWGKGDRSDILVASSRNGLHRRPKRLTHSRDASDPVWSPDGQYIAYIRLRDLDGARLVIMRARDGAAQRVVANRVDFISKLSWQPRPR